MKRDDIPLIAQLLTSMRDSVRALAVAQKGRDMEKANSIKKEIMYFQNQIDSIL